MNYLKTTQTKTGLPRWLSGKESTCWWGIYKRCRVWFLGWEDSPGAENDNPLQCSCLENSMDRGTWRTTVHGVAKSQSRLINWACRHTDDSNQQGTCPVTRMNASQLHHCTPAAAADASVVSDPVRLHRRQPTRLPRPWDSPGKNTGVGRHFLLQCMKVKTESEVAQSCPKRPHGLWPTRLLRPWDFPNKSTGVGCLCLLRIPATETEMDLKKSPSHNKSYARMVNTTWLKSKKKKKKKPA